jgi:hypothetical protein
VPGVAVPIGGGIGLGLGLEPPRSRVPSGPMASKVTMRHCSGLEVGLLGMLAFLEGAVGDPLQQLNVVPEGTDVTPVDLVRGCS